jgi:hypothetical protein
MLLGLILSVSEIFVDFLFKKLRNTFFYVFLGLVSYFFLKVKSGDRLFWISASELSFVLLVIFANFHVKDWVAL